MLRFILLTAVLLAACPSLVAARPVVAPDSSPELIDDQFELADGAAWDGAGKLYVPDVKAQTLYEYNLRQSPPGRKTILDSIAVSGTAFQLGRLYIADNRGARIAVVDSKRNVQTLAQFDAQERPNDLAVDADGNVYVTITGKGLIRKVTPEGAATDLATGLVTPNGIALSPSGSRLYVSSAKLGTVYQINLDETSPPQQAARTFAQLTETEDGFRGDGMCSDRGGNVYVTGAETVSVFSPDGRSIATIKPPHRPINVVIGGGDERTLYISTFGGLYAVELNAYGVSPNKPIEAAETSGISTAISPEIDATFNRVYCRDGARELLMDCFVQRGNQKPKPAIVVVHGGGWKKGDKTKFRALALRLAERGYFTAAIEYRLSGEAAFPAAIRDCNAATVYLRRHAAEFGIDPDRIAAVGGSAGGHLVGLMAAGHAIAELKHPDDRDADSSLAAAAVLAGPLEIASGSVAERSLKSRASSNSVEWMQGDVRERAALYHLADAYLKVDRSMPPTLFVSGSKDNPERNAKTRQKMDSYEISNRLVVHPDATHGHWNRAEWIGRVVDDIDAFFQQQM